MRRQDRKVSPEPARSVENIDGVSARGDASDQQSMVQSVEAATSAWLDQMAAMRRVETEFAAKLVRSKTAPEAVSICAEWVAKRVDSLVAVQHHLIDLWLQCQNGSLERDSIEKPAHAEQPPSNATPAERAVAHLR